MYLLTAGGLISYGPNFNDEARRAANYADRILKGEKPANLPVQAPTKYELVINLKTAKTLGLSVPPTQLTRADDIISQPCMPPLAQSGHRLVHCTCLLLGVKRTFGLSRAT